MSKIKISPSLCILETYFSAPECPIMVCLRHPFESVARTIKQKRLANRDKNPAIFFYSLSCDRRATGGWLNSVRASTDKRQTPLLSSFVCFKRHLFDDLDGLRGFSRFEGVKRSSRHIRRETRETWGCMVRKDHIWIPPERSTLSSRFYRIVPISVPYHFKHDQCTNLLLKEANYNNN